MESDEKQKEDPSNTAWHRILSFFSSSIMTPFFTYYNGIEHNIESSSDIHNIPAQLQVPNEFQPDISLALLNRLFATQTLIPFLTNISDEELSKTTSVLKQTVKAIYTTNQCCLRPPEWLIAIYIMREKAIRGHLDSHAVSIVEKISDKYQVF